MWRRPLGVRDIHCSTYEHDLKLNRSWFQALNLIPGAREFRTTWSDIPLFYDDCPTAGTLETEGKIILSFGTYRASTIIPGRDYYGSWTFNNQVGGTKTTDVRLLGQEGDYYKTIFTIPVADVGVQCPIRSQWCIYGIRQGELLPNPPGNMTTWTWAHGTPSYLKYSR